MLITDYFTYNSDLGNLVDKHQAQVMPKGKAGEILPWVHIDSIAKRMLSDVHHKIKPGYLQG